jgi:hypothetical protein
MNMEEANISKAQKAKNLPIIFLISFITIIFSLRHPINGGFMVLD